MFIESTFDFHELGKITPEQANFYLEQFLEECYIEKYTYVLVITGRGNNAETTGKSMLRENIRQQLRKNKYVEKFQTASPWNGGAGAFEVYLKDC